MSSHIKYCGRKGETKNLRTKKGSKKCYPHNNYVQDTANVQSPVFVHMFNFH